ncbi:MAG TPA: hypothetical protein PKA78_01550 [Macellibacteroides fermentans]|uniref:hypothetical protein n=1 Tax=Macellibacteroides fermentans TaxID=879969 RepID=UPI002B65E174|nr:hypothetical protein [Macellibacteroides fermentans]
MIELHDYDNLRLWITIIVSVIAFSWVYKIQTFKVKIWYSLLAAFILIYSGIGGAIKTVNSNYTFYYIVYIIVLSLTLKYFYKKNHLADNILITRYKNTDTLLTKWIDKNGNKFIILYFAMLLFDLVYPIFRLQLLINPPSPSLEDLHYKTFVLGNTKDSISQIVYLLQQFVVPFFYLSLYKYRNSTFKPLILLLLPVYIDLCNRGIIGRGQAMIPLVIVFLVIFEKVKPAKRTLLAVTSLIAIPFLSYTFVQFSQLRIGAYLLDISFGDSIQLLFGQEVGYPLLFNDYYGKGSPVSITEYILWIILLPLPGFLKFGYGDPQVNMKFTMLVTGLDPSQSGFSICLPGLVGESLITFGQYLFPLHAIILGTIVSYLIKYLSKYDSYKFIFFYVATIFSYNICRGGTASSYSFVFKQFIILLLFIYYLKKKYRV